MSVLRNSADLLVEALASKVVKVVLLRVLLHEAASPAEVIRQSCVVVVVGGCHDLITTDQSIQIHTRV